MAKRRKSRRSRRSRRGLGCVGCGPIGPGPSLTGLGFMGGGTPWVKYGLMAAAAYFVYTKFVKKSPGVAGFNEVVTFGRNGADYSLNRPQAGVAVEIPTGYSSRG